MAHDEQRPNLLIWGAGGHAKVVAEIVRLEGRYTLLGFLDDTAPERWGTPFWGATVLGGSRELSALRERAPFVIVAIGNNAARMKLAAAATAAGFELGTAVHPRATVAADVVLGPGTVVIAGAVVNPSARVGSNVIVNTCASVDHDCEVGDGVLLSPGVRLAGGAKVGHGSWLASGAIVVPGARVGANTTVGAGAVVLDDLPDNVVAYGVPAAVVRRNGAG